MATFTQPLSQVLNPSSAPSTGAPLTTQQTVAGAQKSLASDQQTFLKLLTTQLQHQDPLSPLDPNQFTQQLVAMTGVQQQIVSNQLLQQLVNNQSNMGDPVGLIGKTVTANTAQATLQGGKANWLYSLSSAAQKVQLQVTNSMGQVVWQQTVGPQAAGEQALNWNGKDLNGNQLPDGGNYTLAVTATDSGGGQVGSTIYQRGLASSVQQSGGQNTVTVNGIQVPTSSVIAVGAGA
jgi:flagellar basal-body rod modification protein FlgD